MTRQRLETLHQLDDDVIDIIESGGESGDGSLHSNSDSSERITPDTCAIMREMADRGHSRRGIAREFDWVSYTQVKYHVNGRCSCDSGAHVHYDECMRMRIDHHNGIPPRALALLYDTPKSTVSDHINGACTHEDGIPPKTSLPEPDPLETAAAD